MASDSQGRDAGRDRVLPEDDDLALWDEFAPDERHSLVELINRVLDKGVVVTGDVTISVAGVDLVYLTLSALLTSVSTARLVVDRRIGGGSARRPAGDGE